MKDIKKRIHGFIAKNYTRIYGMFHPIEKKILFSSFGGKQYSDNPKAISEKVHILYPEYKIVWFLSEASSSLNFLPDYVTPIVKKKGLEFYKALSTSFCYVTNTALRTNIHKRKGQFLTDRVWLLLRGLSYPC